MTKISLRLLLIYFLCMRIVCAKAFPFIGAAAGLQFDPAYTGFMANWFAGYGFTFDCYHTYYLGGEVFVDYPSAAISGKQTQRILSAEGANLTAGVFMNPLYDLYIKLGVQHSQIKHNSSAEGSLYGLGMEGILNRNWSFRVEDVFVSQGVFSDFNLRANTIRLGGIYRFT